MTLIRFTQRDSTIAQNSLELIWRALSTEERNRLANIYKELQLYLVTAHRHATPFAFEQPENGATEPWGESEDQYGSR